MNAWTDWQLAFEILFQSYQPNNVLEFGLGEGTRFFLKKGYETTSVELAWKKEHVDWYKKYEDNINPLWERHLYQCKDVLEPKVEKYIKKKLDKKYDLIFVDSGVHFRADIVNLCFGKADVIAAHDTNGGHDAYGWDKIKIPEEYAFAHYNGGQGTSFWMKDKTLGKKVQALFLEAHE